MEKRRDRDRDQEYLRRRCRRVKMVWGDTIQYEWNVIEPKVIGVEWGEEGAVG
jgi:hypothetical protein